jgi:hypothetical protein
MLKRFITCLKDFWLDLVLSWHADRADRMREDQSFDAAQDREPKYWIIRRERLFPNGQPEPPGVSYVEPLLPDRRPWADEPPIPIQPAAAHCVNCGHRGSVLVPDGTEPPDVENEVLDMLECPVCGLYTMCSD